MATYDVITDHVVVAFGDDRMVLFDNTGIQLAQAVRSGVEDPWVITATSLHSVVSLALRSEAIMQLTEFGLAESGGPGYSTFVPHGLWERP